MMDQDGKWRVSGTLSFDKGFWSPGNQVQLERTLDVLVLPKKGKLSRKDKERETSPEFREIRLIRSYCIARQCFL